MGNDFGRPHHLASGFTHGNRVRLSSSLGCDRRIRNLTRAAMCVDGYVTISVDDLERLQPPGGWPNRVFTTPYAAAAHPQWPNPRPMDEGANCQRFAYAVLELFGHRVAPHRSSELWTDHTLQHVDRIMARPLDLALFNAADDAMGAHVAVVVQTGLLHLCAEVGTPAVWSWSDFASRIRYNTLVGVVRTS